MATRNKSKNFCSHINTDWQRKKKRETPKKCYRAGYWRQVTSTSIIHDSRTWHRSEQDGVNDNENLTIKGRIQQKKNNTTTTTTITTTATVSKQHLKN